MGDINYMSSIELEIMIIFILEKSMCFNPVKTHTEISNKFVCSFNQVNEQSCDKE